MGEQEIIKEGELLFQQGKLREAEEQFLIAIQSDPANKEAHNNLGVIAFSEMDHEKAIFHFKNALNIDPLYMDAILNLCDVLQSTNSLAEALPIIEKALAMNPENKDLREMLKKEDPKNIMVQANKDIESMDPIQDETRYPKTDLHTKKVIKVIQLPLIIANTAIALSKYLNRLGVESKVISYFRTWLNYQGDINLDLDGLNSADRNKKVREFVDYFFENEAHKYDIFHFHFFDTLSTGTSFGGWKSHPEREDYWDLQKLKEMGKKIVVSSWGSDVRNNSKIVYYQLKYEEVSADIPYPPLNRKDQYNKIWKFAQYSDAIVHGDQEVCKHTPNGIMIPGGIDLEPFDLLMAGNRVTDEKKSILYAPSNQFYKGTNYTEAVLKRINDRYGEKIEIRKIHGLPYHEAIKRYLGNGAAVDDIAIFSFGLFTLEAMYLGRSVFATLRKEEYFGDDPKLKAPIINVNNKQDFYNKLVDFIDLDYVDHNDEYKGFILNNFSALVMAQKYKKLYERLLSGEKIEHYISQEWYKEFNLVLCNQKIDKRDYYPKVTDLLLEKKELEKLLHEVQMGMGLNDDVDLLAKYILALEVTNQEDPALAARMANKKLVSTGAFMQRYKRAKDLYYSSAIAQCNTPNQQR
ncbi:MAG: tetratricopeptide repeat protein [Syntrophales bacterium LBB04]|nr:tetratricopeptide repeat protein [Syntrophales bacterium LBB04]